MNRPNLRYEVVRREALETAASFPAASESAAVGHLVALAARAVEDSAGKEAGAGEDGGPAGIVFARTRDECDRVAGLLVDAGMDVVSYHAGKSRETLARAQRDWSAGDLHAVVATVAFGMGVDKPNVRWVAHWGRLRRWRACTRSRGARGGTATSRAHAVRGRGRARGA